MKTKWTEALVGAAVQRQVFNRAVLAVPCCGWTGHEADLLVVTRDLRIVDVEVKISRSDLKADYAKDKWWRSRPWSRSRHRELGPRQWPDKVWKHYYALPESIWDASLLAHLPPASGVMLLGEPRASGEVKISVMRMARPNKDAKPIGAADAVDIARLANLRMWAALTREQAARGDRRPLTKEKQK